MNKETKPKGSWWDLHGMLKGKGVRLSIEDINDAIAETGAAAGAGEYDEFLQRKVELARAQRDAGLLVSNKEVEAEAAARRAELLRHADEADL